MHNFLVMNANKESKFQVKWTDFFLSISGISVFSALSTITYNSAEISQQLNLHLKKFHHRAITDRSLTGILSGYFSLMREASACLLSDMKSKPILEQQTRKQGRSSTPPNHQFKQQQHNSQVSNKKGINNSFRL